MLYTSVADAAWEAFVIRQTDPAGTPLLLLNDTVGDAVRAIVLSVELQRKRIAVSRKRV
jgi:hypothetical protein